MEDALTNIQMPIFHLDIYKQEEGHFVGVGYKSFRKSICKGPKQMLVWGNWQCQAGVIQGQQGLGALIRDFQGDFQISKSHFLDQGISGLSTSLYLLIEVWEVAIEAASLSSFKVIRVIWHVLLFGLEGLSLPSGKIIDRQDERPAQGHQVAFSNVPR